MQKCRSFLATLRLPAAYVDPAHDRCYCQSCASAAQIPDVLEISSPHGLAYEVPKGWCGFGLRAQARAEALNVFQEWAVSFHGTQSSRITSILDNNGLLKPGDVLLDGTTLPNRLTRGGADGKGKGRIGFYTSPSIKYSELDIYTTPDEWEGHKVRVVLQCRQKPGSFTVEGETIGWARRFGSAPISTHFGNDKIERFTEAGPSIIPYRILVGLDVTTREEEEARKKAELQELRQRLAASEKRLEEAQRAEREAQLQVVQDRAALAHASGAHA
jgi:hypothetical protein